MNVGDKVWATVARDKERVGTIIESDSVYYLIRFESGIDGTYPKNKIRPYGEEAKKNDSEKNRMELIPVSGIEGIGKAMTFGAQKYSAHNWANGFDWLRLCGSAMRHLTAWMSGQDKDPESGLSHLDHLGACVVMLIAHETEGLGNDDRRKTKN